MQNYDDRVDALLASVQELRLALSGDPVEFPDAEQPPECYDFKDVYELIDRMIGELCSIRKAATLKHVYKLSDQLEKLASSAPSRQKLNRQTEQQRDLFLKSSDI